MSKRIDLAQLENQYKERIEHNSLYAPDADKEDDLFVLSDLIAELKKMYAREDELLDALRIIRDDLNEGMAQGHLPIESTHGVSARKIRNFANDALLGMSVDKPKCRNCGATTNLHQNRFDKKHDCGACLQELQDMNDFDSQHTF